MDWRRKIEWKIPVLAKPTLVDYTEKVPFAELKDGFDIIEWGVASSLQSPTPVKEEERENVRRLCKLAEFQRISSLNSTLKKLDLDQTQDFKAAPVSYHPFDPAFLMDEIERVEKERIAARKLELAIIKEMREGKACPVEYQNIQRPATKKGGVNGGPGKKDLQARRVAQYGGMMYSLGFWDNTDSPQQQIKQIREERVKEMKLIMEKRLPPQEDLDPCGLRRRMRPECFGKQQQLDKLSGESFPVELMSRNAKAVLFEYLEQNPILQNHIGIRSRIIHLSRLKENSTRMIRETDTPIPNELELVWDEPSPLMTDLAPGESLQFLRNRVMNVPLFEQEHKTFGNDFCLFTDTNELMKIHSFHSLGQVEPRTTIPSPAYMIQDETGVSKDYIAYTFLWELYTSNTLRVPVQEMVDRFPLASSKTVNTAIRTYGEAKERGLWELRDDIDEKETALTGAVAKPKAPPRKKDKDSIRSWIQVQMSGIFQVGSFTPFCAWQAMERAVNRYRAAGITHLISRGVRNSVIEDMQELRQAYQMHVRLRRLAMEADMTFRSATPNTARANLEMRAMKYVMRELMCSPWYLAECFYRLFREVESEFNPFPPRTVMHVTGFGDPSGRGEMVSFHPNSRYVDPNDIRPSLKKSGEPSTLKEKMTGDTVTTGEEEDGEDEEQKQGGENHDVEMIPLWRKRKNSKYTNDVKVVHGGTQSDLRNLSMIQLGDILIQLGIPEDEVVKIDRWDRTWMVENAASSANGKDLLGGEIAKYSRTTSIYGELNATSCVRSKIEKSSEFKEMRQLCTDAYKRLYKFAKPQRYSTRNTEVSLRDLAPSCGGASQTEADEIESGEQEKDRLEQFSSKMVRLNQNAESARKAQTQDEMLMEWMRAVHEEQIRLGTPRRKITKRVVVNLLSNGTEVVHVEYLRGSTAAEPYKRKPAEQQWDSVEVVDGGRL